MPAEAEVGCRQLQRDVARQKIDDLRKRREHDGTEEQMKSREAQDSVADRKLVWGFAVPQSGRVRFTITLTPAGEWSEVGEFSSDGTAWSRGPSRPFLESASSYHRMHLL